MESYEHGRWEYLEYYARLAPDNDKRGGLTPEEKAELQQLRQKFGKKYEDSKVP